MSKNLENLSRVELTKLRQEIDERLMAIEIKRTKSKKDKLFDLRVGDKIFGIRLSYGPHRLAEPEELIGEVDIIDYCVVDQMDLRDSGDFRIGINYRKGGFGVLTTLYKDEEEDEHCLLELNTMKTGYDAFYTLKPKKWKEDLKKKYDEILKSREKRYQEELKIYQDKLNLFLAAEEKINKLT